MFPWFKKKSSAKTAKDRLTIAIMSDRTNNSFPFMEDLKAEIIEVVKKYIDVKKVDIQRDTQDGIEALSIDIELEK
jgi:cell division topological specificity factor